MAEKTREVEQLETALALAKKEIDAKQKIITELKQQIMEIERKYDKDDDV